MSVHGKQTLLCSAFPYDRAKRRCVSEALAGHLRYRKGGRYFLWAMVVLLKLWCLYQMASIIGAFAIINISLAHNKSSSLYFFFIRTGFLENASWESQYMNSGSSLWIISACGKGGDLQEIPALPPLPFCTAQAPSLQPKSSLQLGDAERDRSEVKPGSTLLML